MFSHLVQIKCDQYWPNRGTETYGFIQVTLLDTIELATFCVRTFSLHKVGPGWNWGAVGGGDGGWRREMSFCPGNSPLDGRETTLTQAGCILKQSLYGWGH